MRLDCLLASTVIVLSASVTALPEPFDKRQSPASWDRFSPPWYTAPPGGTVPQWKNSYDKAWTLVKQMTLVEKVNITSGLGWAMGLCVGNTGPVPRLGFPSLCLQDGPLGIRFADKITSFPAGITTGSTFNKELFFLRGKAIGAEAHDKGINVLLGPAMGPIGRHPAGGRNWEGFGNDAYLQGIASAEFIKGVQSENVIATAKHLVGNEQEHFRQSFDAISSNIDDRTLHELYGWPFGDAVHAGVGSVMCSYQRLNESHACHNSKLMNGFLKDELGFQGFIHSDWLAAMSGVGSALAGLDMMMPGDGLYWDDRNPLWGPQLTTAVLNSSVPYDRLDDMATRIVATWYKYNNGDNRIPNFSSWTKNTLGKLYHGSNEGPDVLVNEHRDVRRNHDSIAKKVAIEGTVLLRNTDGLLPLKKQKKIGIYGEGAGPGDGPNACADRGCNQGTLAVGWGSGTTDFEYLIDPLSQITADAAKRGAKVVFELDNNKTAEAAASAAKQDVCIVFGNADSGEGFISWDGNNGDRKDLKLQRKSEDMIIAVAKACKNTVVVIHSVGQIDMEAFIGIKNIKSILWANLPGQESGRALSDVIFGVANPSGKLPYTIARKFSDYGPTAPITTSKGSDPYPQADFTEGIFTDYKRFDTYSIKPRFEFGFGLSYTTFSLTSINLTRLGSRTALPPPRPETLPPINYDSTIPPATEAEYPPGFTKINRMLYPYIPSASSVTPGPYPYPEGYTTPPPLSPAGGGEGGHPALWTHLYEVSVTVTNTGSVPGAEVVQLYLEYPGVKEVKMPKRQLRGFEKVFLQPGESRRVRLRLTRRDVSYWSTRDQNWRIPQGEMTVRVGRSCRLLEKAVRLPDY